MSESPAETVITGLADTAVSRPDSGGPDIKALAHLNGATVVRLSFRSGQTMAETTRAGRSSSSARPGASSSPSMTRQRC